MTPEEIRGLVGGYATGSLSAAERKALFEAALDDQELFDELGREQVLKELLDEPGVKARLLTALAPRRLSGVWVWAAAGAFAMAAVVGVALLKKPPEREIAQVIARPTLPEPQAAPLPVVPPPVVRPTQVVPHAPAPRIPEPAPKPASPPPPEPAAASLQKTEATPAAPAVPASQQAAAVGALDAFTVSGTNSLVAAGEAGAVGGGRGGGGGGGRGGAARALAAPSEALRARAPGFAFDYSLTTERALRIAPASNGFLTVGASNGSAMAVLFNNRPQQAGVVTLVPLPADCVAALVMFSARELPAGSLSITSPADAPAGTKSEPNPTPDTVLIAVVPVSQGR
jgi:hypothetical protein